MAAADVLATCALRLGDSMIGLAPMVMEELETVRFDKVKPVREAVLEAVEAFAPLLPVPDAATAAKEKAERTPKSALPPRSARRSSRASSGSTTSHQELFSSPAPSESPGASSDASELLRSSSGRELGSSKGAVAEEEIGKWAAEEESRGRKRTRKRSARVPLSAQQPNPNFFRQQDQAPLLARAQREHEAIVASTSRESPEEGTAGDAHEQRKTSPLPHQPEPEPEPEPDPEKQPAPAERRGGESSPEERPRTAESEQRPTRPTHGRSHRSAEAEVPDEAPSFGSSSGWGRLGLSTEDRQEPAAVMRERPATAEAPQSSARSPPLRGQSLHHLRGSFSPGGRGDERGRHYAPRPGGTEQARDHPQQQQQVHGADRPSSYFETVSCLQGRHAERTSLSLGP